MFICRTVLDDDVAAFNEAGIPKPLHKSFGGGGGIAGPNIEPTDDRRPGLRARDVRRGDRHAAEAGDEGASPQASCHLVPPTSNGSACAHNAYSTGLSRRL